MLKKKKRKKISEENDQVKDCESEGLAREYHQGSAKNVMTYRYHTKDQQSCSAVVESEANTLHFDYISVRLRV